ncbi:Uncharacterised protein [Serratia liquefaciens]|nr:Uncharacterised protein [Serratia liquefaciens]
MDSPHARRQILSSRRGLFKGLRTDTTEMTVAPGPVIEDFNVIEDTFGYPKITTRTQRLSVFLITPSRSLLTAKGKVVYVFLQFDF